MLTDQDLENIRDSWQYVVQDELQNMLKFYTRLFEIAPEVRMYFPDDMTKLAEKLSYTLNILVSNLEDFESLKPTLENLGRKHRQFGVESYHYKYVVDALLYTVKQIMDVHYRKEIGISWKKALVAVSTVMINAPKEKANRYTSFLKRIFG